MLFEAGRGKRPKLKENKLPDLSNRAFSLIAILLGQMMVKRFISVCKIRQTFQNLEELNSTQSFSSCNVYRELLSISFLPFFFLRRKNIVFPQTFSGEINKID